LHLVLLRLCLKINLFCVPLLFCSFTTSRCLKHCKNQGHNLQKKKKKKVIQIIANSELVRLHCTSDLLSGSCSVWRGTNLKIQKDKMPFTCKFKFLSDDFHINSWFSLSFLLQTVFSGTIFHISLTIPAINWLAS
jgi:hypothetical protein